MALIVIITAIASSYALQSRFEVANVPDRGISVFKSLSKALSA